MAAIRRCYESRAAHPGDIEAALTAYEAAMFPRSRTAAEDQILALCLDDNAPQGIIEFFTGMGKE